MFDIEALTLPAQDALLAGLPVDEVWGVGARLRAALVPLGITTAGALRDAAPAALRAHFGVTLERTARELRGESCLDWTELPPPRQQIVSSRSFGTEITAFEALREAVLTYTARAAERLRADGSVAGRLQVWVSSNPFKADAVRYHRAAGLTLPVATDDTLTLSAAATQSLRAVWRDGVAYKKAGVMLLDLAPRAQRQAGLFEDAAQIDRRQRLNLALDAVNARYGRDRLRVAGSGRPDLRSWRARQQWLSPSWTTDWLALPMAH